MKKIVLVLLFIVSAILPAIADTDLGDDFGKHFGPNSNLSAYNKDISNLIGMADFHSGSAPAFPGFDLGVTFNAIKPSGSNNISSEDYLMAGFVSASTRIPVIGLGAVVRGTYFNGLESIGGGLTYHTNVLEFLNVSAGAFYDHARTDYYSLNHYSVSVTASTSLLIFTPYAGIGYDYGDISTRKFGSLDRSSKDGSMRYTVGVNAKVLPFIYVFAAYTKTQGDGSINGGVGFSF